MTTFQQTFAHRHAVLPVIHLSAADDAAVKLAVKNAEIAYRAGCDGAFLINHGAVSVQQMLGVFDAVRQALPNFWLGLNLLGVPTAEVFARLPDSAGGVWVDNACIDERRSNQPEADAIAKARARSGWRGLYFGGVAFKYQREVIDLGAAARISVRYMDVVTTSGVGTGHAASVEKIRQMKAALNAHPLGIASGITPDNVTSYLDYADCFLVATGISRTFVELDPERVRQLVQIVRGWHE